MRTRKKPNLPALLLACALLGGCAYPGHDGRLVPGVSIAADISSYYGAPRRIWDEPDGGKTYEYSSQPFGQTCYMIRFGPDGKFVKAEDTLLYASRFSITPGMTPEQVPHRLGQERSRIFYRLSGEDVWDWNVQPDQTGYLLRFNVHFKNGVVLRLSQSMVFPSRVPSLD